MSSVHPLNRELFRKTLADWLLRNRLALGLSQLEVADAIGASDASLSKWERGLHDISAYFERRLRSYFRAQWDARDGQEAQRAA